MVGCFVHLGNCGSRSVHRVLPGLRDVLLAAAFCVEAVLLLGCVLSVHLGGVGGGAVGWGLGDAFLTACWSGLSVKEHCSSGGAGSA